MRKYISRLASLFVLLAIIAGALAIPAFAFEFRKGTNDASTSYKNSIYYKNLTSVPMTGDGRTDVLAVALSQLGYVESDKNGEFSGTAVGGKDNYTEYNYNMGSFGSGYGGKDYPWCACFVSFCLFQAGCHDQSSISDWCRKNEGDAKYIWREVSCNKWATQLRSCGYFRDSAAFDGDYKPIAGDLIFFTTNGVTESHIGLVLYCDGNSVYTVEGNTSPDNGLETNGGGVYAKSYSLTSTYIRGYGVLPYKVNNNVQRIDYSGTLPSCGIYVAASDKYVYSSEIAGTYDRVLPKNTLFNVTEILPNGRLKVAYNIDGVDFEGYLKNDSDRVIQISCDEKSQGYGSLERTWGLVGACTDEYFGGDKSYAEKPGSFDLKGSESIGISGWIGFTREISAVGYYFDTDCEKITWCDSDSLTTENSVTVLGGKYSKRYRCEASVEALLVGAHTVSFVVKLNDGEISKIDTLSFIKREENKNIPNPPTIASFDEGSVTLNVTEGYEYSLGDGHWQTSGVFDGLSAQMGISYSFFARIAQTETQLASLQSDALTVDLYKLNAARKLSSLEIDGALISPSFDPDVYKYFASVDSDVENVGVKASAPEGSEISIESTEIGEGEKGTTVKITVTPSIGEKAEYYIEVTRKELQTSAPEESTKDNSTSTPLAPDEQFAATDTAVYTEDSEIHYASDAIITAPATKSEGCGATLGGISAFTVLLCAGFALKTSKKENE